jgi:transposase
MSNLNVSVSGSAQGARRATEAGPETGRGGKGRWSAKRKRSVVLELLRGADLESASRKYGVTAATLSEWRDAFLAAGEEGLKIRQEDLVDEQGRRMKSVIAELAMENELLRERIRRMEDEKPFLRWRSRR